MIIGFEAKRIFQNTTGLGNSTRSIINALATNNPQNQYHLFAPKKTNLFNTNSYKNIFIHTPNSLLNKTLKFYWRSKNVVKDLIKNNIQIYHGLAGELPIGLQHTTIKKVVFIHDIIFEKYPKQYNPIDVFTYRKKTKFACKIADAITVNSNQTKQDLITFYNVPEHKLDLVYLSCNPIFLVQHLPLEISAIKQKYHLPPKYFLYVGSIIERKGLLQICKAYSLQSAPMPPLVVIGNGDNKYLMQVKNYIQENNLQNQIFFLNETDAKNETDFKNSKDFPAIYQGAEALIYPSEYEGFGLPIVEAMSSGLPVITSNCSCMPEIGGDACVYINPKKPNEILQAMQSIISDNNLKTELILKGKIRANFFSEKMLAERIMKVYEKI